MNPYSLPQNEVNLLMDSIESAYSLFFNNTKVSKPINFKLLHNKTTPNKSTNFNNGLTEIYLADPHTKHNISYFYLEIELGNGQILYWSYRLFDSKEKNIENPKLTRIEIFERIRDLLKT